MKGSGHLLDPDRRLTLVHSGTPATEERPRASSTEGEVIKCCCSCQKSTLCWRPQEDSACGDGLSLSPAALLTILTGVGPWSIFEA